MSKSLLNDSSSSGYKKLLSYQVIPKYYLLSGERDIIILYFSMGLGKTISSLHIVNNYLTRASVTSIIKIFIPNFSRINYNNIFVIGSWQTSSQMENDLNKNLLNNDDDIASLLHQRINFYGYQSFFNFIFGKDINQDINALLQMYDRNEIEIPLDVEGKIRDSIIIVDEMQRLYNSSTGLNSYGFTFLVLSKLVKTFNMKIVYLSGTIVNLNTLELIDIINICTNEYLHRNDFATKIEDVNGNAVRYMNEIYYDKIADRLSNIIMYKINEDINKYTLIKLKLSDNHIYNNVGTFNRIFIYVSNNVDENTVQLLYSPPTNVLPAVIHVGVDLINKDMSLYSLKMQGNQLKNFTKDENISEDQIDESLSNNNINIFDAFLPLKSEWNAMGIYKDHSVYTGKFLDISTIKKYSIVGDEIFKICFNNALRNEKTAVYHQKVNTFGLLQYAEILKYNGFVPYGEKHNKNSLCKKCGHKFYEHSLNIDDKLKLRICNNFIPITYGILYGDLSQTTRDELLEGIYNNPNNLYGDQMTIVFLSDIAYYGISLLNTNNLIVASPVTSISKWKQIYARIVRLRSHSLLPPEKRYCKIYTFIVKSGKENIKKNRYYNYYNNKVIHDIQITKFNNIMKDKSVLTRILNGSEVLKVDYEIYINDLKREIKHIINMLNNKNVLTEVWNMGTLIKTIQSMNYASYIDFSLIPKSVIQSLITEMYRNNIYKINNNIVFKYNNLNNKVDNMNIIPFYNLQNIQIEYEKNVQSLINRLNTKMLLPAKSILLQTIINVHKNNYRSLGKIVEFWDEIYEIGDEYYDDDETNYIYNHSTKNRSRNKLTGFYYKENIILKDGTVKPIHYEFITPDMKNIKRIYRISSFGLMTKTFYNVVNIVDIIDHVADGRKTKKGINCASYDITKIKEVKLSESSKLNKCIELLPKICEYQYEHPDIKLVYTPFEK